MKTCDHCHTPFDGPFTKCHTCLDVLSAPLRAQADDIAKREAAHLRTQLWKELCPVEYNRTDWSRPDLSPVCRHLAKNWWPNWTAEDCGLGIFGSTGQGKTRAMYAILRRLHFAGISCLAVDATAFARAASTWNDNDRRTQQDSRLLLRRCQDVRVLLIDDIGKEPATRPVASGLHELLEVRTRNRRVLLFTSERTGAELATNFGEHYADGIIRRLRGTCQIHEATPAPQPA